MTIQIKKYLVKKNFIEPQPREWNEFDPQTARLKSLSIGDQGAIIEVIFPYGFITEEEIDHFLHNAERFVGS